MATKFPLVRTDDSFENNLRDIKNTHLDTLVFWLNEFCNLDLVWIFFTLRTIETAGMKQTGPSSAA